ncbi:unnamed protein product, partial [Staurois parvus]
CAVSFGHSRSPIYGKSRRCWLDHVISCVQTQLITWDMYTDHQSTDDQCALMICVASAAPPASVHQCQLCAHSCHLPVPISATSMPHISAHLTCLSVSPISAASQCRLSVPISDACQCPSVPPTSASSSV